MDEVKRVQPEVKKEGERRRKEAAKRTGNKGAWRRKMEKMRQKEGRKAQRRRKTDVRGERARKGRGK